MFLIFFCKHVLLQMAIKQKNKNYKQLHFVSMMSPVLPIFPTEF